MELEQRIKALEYELKILKNEVQRTLLDVQDQVLSQYPPALGTEKSKPAEGSIQAIETSRSRQTARPAATAAPAAPPPTAPSEVRAVAVASVAAAAPAVPLLKKVSLEEIRAAESELAAEASPAKPVSVDKLVEWVKKPDSGLIEGGTGDAATLAERGGIKLLEWLMSSATKVNGERDEKRVKEVLDQLTKLNSLVDRASTMEEALRLIEEAKLG